MEEYLKKQIFVLALPVILIRGFINSHHTYVELTMSVSRIFRRLTRCNKISTATNEITTNAEIYREVAWRLR